MHSRRLAVATLTFAFVSRWMVRLAPIVGCVLLASKLRSLPPAPLIEAASTDATPAPAPSEVDPPPPSLPTPARGAPAAEALTTSSIFSEVQMVSPRVGWAWGKAAEQAEGAESLSRTDDGGRIWTEVGPEGCDHFVQGPLRAWVVACDTHGGRVHFTTDGGRTWSYVGTVSLTDQRIPTSARALQFTDAMNGFVELTFGIEGEDTSLFHTSDGGRSWREVGGSPWDATTSFVDAHRGWRVSNHQQLDRTTDGGQTWTAHPDLVACAVDTVPSFEGRAGMVLGNCPSGLHAFYTSDGGDRWVAGAKVDLVEPAIAAHGTQAWMWTGQELLRTKDGGRTLEPSTLDAPTDTTTFQIVSPTRGFAMRAADDDLVVSRTADNGRTFTAVLTTPSSNAYGLSFSDPEHGVFFASFTTGTRVLSTSDGGASWRFLR